MQLELKKQKKKTALLQAAYELFLKKGVPLTSVGDITAKASVAKGTFYLYFRDKEDILGAVSAAVLRQILEEGYMKMGAGRTGNFTENLIQLADAALDYLQQNRGVLEILRRGGRMPKLSREDPPSCGGSRNRSRRLNRRSMGLSGRRWRSNEKSFPRDGKLSAFSESFSYVYINNLTGKHPLNRLLP